MKFGTVSKGILLQLILANGALASTTVNDLTLDCQAQAQVTNVRGAVYNAGLPPKGRFMGQPASSGFTATVKMTTLSPDCAKLKSKYDLNVDGFTLDMDVSTGQVLQQPKLNAFAEAVVGTIIPVTLKQTFQYQTTNGGYLPLFPLVHGESLSFSGTAESHGIQLNAGVMLNPNINWVYGITPIESMSDIEKLALAEKAAGLAPFQGLLADFDDLLLRLEPHATALKQAYAQLLWGVLHQLKVKSPYHQNVLDFHVGGEGSSEGRPLAQKLVLLSYEDAFSDAQLSALVEDLPTILLVQENQGKCLNISGAALENALVNVEAVFGAMSLSEKGYFRDPLSQLSGKVQFMVSLSCLKDNVTPKVKAIAESLLEDLE